MPPDAPYPAAMDDAIAVWKAAFAMRDPSRMAIVGTATGGGVTLAMILRAKQDGLALRAATAGARRGPIRRKPATAARPTNGGQCSCQLQRLSQPRRRTLRERPRHEGSAAVADLWRLPWFPPAILTSGTRDLLLSYTVRTHRKLREAGVEAYLQVFEGLSHAQYLFDPSVPETKAAFEEITAFFDRHLAK
jgi:monoterpene epsilon-lactone hydrolase